MSKWKPSPSGSQVQVEAKSKWKPNPSGSQVQLEVEDQDEACHGELMKLGMEVCWCRWVILACC